MLSPTLRGLVDQLERSDLIVYVAEERRSAGRSAAWIQFVGATHHARVLYITLDIGLELRARLALLGHELQHALEVAGNPGIRDPELFLQYYEQLGIEGKDHLSRDSQAARETGERIRQELVPARASR